MSIEAMVRVFKHSRTKGMTRLVLLVIANHETEGRGAFPSIDTIAASAACGERTVQESITRAKKLGELAVDYRCGPNGTNLYRVLTGLTTEPLPYPGSRGVQDMHPADTRRESAPELKEPGFSSVVGLASSDSDVEPKARPALTRPTDRQVYLAEKITERWAGIAKGGRISIPALQKLNTAYGVDAVSSALGLLRQFEPKEAVRSAYAYVEAICNQEAAS